MGDGGIGEGKLKQEVESGKMEMGSPRSGVRSPRVMLLTTEITEDTESTEKAGFSGQDSGFSTIRDGIVGATPESPKTLSNTETIDERAG